MSQHLVSFLTTDPCGMTRGRAVSAARAPSQLDKGCGWVPANIALTPFDEIAADNPYGSAGDLRLIPDPATKTEILSVEGLPPLAFYQGDLQNLDGTPWEGCLRHMLQSAIAKLEADFGLRVIAAFEHEFSLSGETLQKGASFSLASLRGAGDFPNLLWQALEEAGLAPETVLPEYGPGQYEIVIAPADALTAADRAVALREITREVARCQNLRASFTPKPSPLGVGNGVHIHLSFTDLHGNPVTYDKDREGGLSVVAAKFASGILRHMPALTALCAPSVVSYQRLRPHNWSAAWTTLGDKDREATLRICPTSTKPGYDPSRAFNMEFRAADATASPHLSLAVLILAGIEGLRDGSECPVITKGDPETFSAEKLATDGIKRLPSSPAEALAAFGQDSIVQSWFSPNFIHAYTAMRRFEAELTAGWDDEEICRRYGAIY